MSLAPLDPTRLPAGWREPVTAWADDLTAAGRTESTVAGYTLHLGWLATDLAAVAPDPWRMSSNLLTGWLDAHNWSMSTRRKVLVSLRSFYTWAVNEARCPRSPLAGVPTLPRRTSGPDAIAMPRAWAEPAEAWCEWLAASSARPGTLHVRRFWLRQLAELHADPWAVTADDLARFLSREDWKPETKRGARTTLRVFYRWAEQTGRVGTSPAADLRPVRIPRTVPRPVPDHALAEALAKADDRTRLVLALGVFAGLRRAEIAAVHTRDVADGSLRITGKGGNERLVPLHPELEHLLSRELRQRREGTPRPGWPRTPEPDGWLFPGTDPERHLTAWTIGALLERVLPAGWTPHTLRHRFATQAYASQRDLRAVQELLGHANPATTVRYAAVPDGALVSAVAGVSLPMAANHTATAADHRHRP